MSKNNHHSCCHYLKAAPLQSETGLQLVSQIQAPHTATRLLLKWSFHYVTFSSKCQVVLDWFSCQVQIAYRSRPPQSSCSLIFHKLQLSSFTSE